MQAGQGRCVSIFMPTHRVGPETQQDPIRLKNLLAQAEERLLAAGLRTPEARQLLAPAHALLSDGLFWRYQSDGLAVFLTQDTFRYHRLPFDFDELVVVADRFHLKPLLSVLGSDERFYVLALSQNEVRLLEGTRFSVSEVDLEDVPPSLAEALRHDDPERQLQFHTRTRTPAGQARRPAIFHGHGVGVNDVKPNILRYFRQIDDGLRDVLRGEQAPLIPAGVDYLLPLYKEANTYPHLVDEGIIGNPEALSAKELHERAWAIVQPLFHQAQEEAATRYKQLADSDSDRVSHDLTAIVPAAYHGRVETLFVTVGLQKWGAFDAALNRIELREQAQPGNEDLLDFAAVQTLINGGTVYAVAPDRMPDSVLIAAIFRY